MVGTPVSAPSTAASAFAQSKSSSPNTWKRAFATVTPASLSDEEKIASRAASA